jgi:membrane protein
MDDVKAMIGSLKRALKVLKSNDPLILCSSTAFFATFSISPFILLLVDLFSIYFKSEKIGDKMFQSIGATFGNETGKDIESIVHNFMALESNWLITFGVSVFFLFVATTLLMVVKKAIHKLWRIRPKPRMTLKYYGWERGTAVLFMFYSGILFLISILVHTGLSVSLDYLRTIWTGAAIVAVRILSLIFSLVVVSIWFTLTFRLLPDARVKWDVAFAGGLLTGILFNTGQWILSKVLIHSRLASIFGATTSLAVILLFIFYCSFILYYGAAFTHAYAIAIDRRIVTSKYSNLYEEKLLETID